MGETICADNAQVCVNGTKGELILGSSYTFIFAWLEVTVLQIFILNQICCGSTADTALQS